MPELELPVCAEPEPEAVLVELLVCVCWPLPEFHDPPSPPVEAGSCCVASTGCAPSEPLPTVTHWPVEGMPLTTTKTVERGASQRQLQEGQVVSGGTN